MLLFLNSEEYFSKDKFKEFEELMSWDINRFDRLKRDEWILVYRKRKGRVKGLYTLSFKANHMITSMYKKLNGEEIPETSSKNPMFHRKVKYTDKVYRNFIKSMNAFIKSKKEKSKAQ